MTITLILFVALALYGLYRLGYWLLMVADRIAQRRKALGAARIGAAGDFKLWIHRHGECCPELLVDKPNTITNDFRSQIVNRLTDGSTYTLMRGANLFATGNIRHSADGGNGTMDNDDGILIIRDTNFNGGSRQDAYTMVTTEITAQQANGKRFRGEIEFSETITVDMAYIGRQFVGEGLASEYFNAPYAYNGFTPVSVQSLDRIIIEWELYLT